MAKKQNPKAKREPNKVMGGKKIKSHMAHLPSGKKQQMARGIQASYHGHQTF